LPIFINKTKRFRHAQHISLNRLPATHSPVLGAEGGTPTGTTFEPTFKTGQSVESTSRDEKTPRK